LPDGVGSLTELEEGLKSRLWRLNNLYYIRDEDGRRVKFKLNLVQMLLFKALWWLNIILKSRQHGITTFACIYFLDECFFNSNTSAGIIAHKLKDVQKIFRDKVKYAYDNMPEVLRERNPAIKDDANELLLSNHSGVYVGVSMRSGTLQLLHVSEYGWLCAHAPQRAKEVKTGALETIHAGGIIIIESTAEGIGNDFHLLCNDAQEKKRSGVKLTRLDFKFHFFNWYTKDSNILDPESVVIDDEMQEYFEKIEAMTGDKISLPHKAWYTKKKQILRQDIYKEHPSIPDEAFISNLEGAYFGHGMVKVKEQKRVGFYPWESRTKVFTFWDTGTIHTAIWFWQFIRAEVRVIDVFYDNTGQGLETFSKLLQEKEYTYAQHYCGWDLNPKNGSNRKNMVTGTPIIEDAERLGIKFICLPQYSFNDRIIAVRDVLDKCTFNEQTCGSIGVPALFNYRQAKNEALSTDDRIVYNKNPVPGPECHIADAFSHGALAYLYHIIVDNKRIGFAHATPAAEQERESRFLAEMEMETEEAQSDYLRS